MEITRYSEVELNEFKILLERKKTDTLRQIAEYDQSLKQIAENGKDEHGLGNAGQDSQTEQLFEFKRRSVKHLNDIENALLRIKNKVYGICTVSKKKIDKRRLLAVPTTTKSIEAKNIIKN